MINLNEDKQHGSHYSNQNLFIYLSIYFLISFDEDIRTSSDYKSTFQKIDTKSCLEIMLTFI